MPGNPQYPLREYLEKLRLWYRIAGVEDEMIGPLIAGRLYIWKGLEIGHGVASSST